MLRNVLDGEQTTERKLLYVSKPHTDKTFEFKKPLFNLPIPRQLKRKPLPEIPHIARENYTRTLNEPVRHYPRTQQKPLRLQRNLEDTVKI